MLYYVTYATFPSQKAHAIQQVNMCSAFSNNGQDVTLVYPENSFLTSKTWDELAERYGINNSFQVESVPVGPGFIGGLPTKYNSKDVSTSVWIALKSFLKKITSNDIIYSRYQIPTYFFCKLSEYLLTDGPSIFFEQHQMKINQLRNQQNFYDLIDGLVLISDFQYEQIKEQYNITKKKMMYAHDGVDLDKYNISVKEARNIVGFSSEDTVISYTGQLYPGKGVGTLIKTADLIDGEIYIIGGYEEDIKRIKNNNCISSNTNFIGMVPSYKIPIYQRASDILVSTHNENTAQDYFSPLKIFEYLAAGKPIVSTRFVTAYEILTHGQNSLIVEPNDPDELANAINRLIHQPELAKKLRTQARSDAASYTWHKRAQSILNFINQDSKVS